MGYSCMVRFISICGRNETNDCLPVDSVCTECTSVEKYRYEVMQGTIRVCQICYRLEHGWCCVITVITTTNVCRIKCN